ncbi:MAG: hypothetical protein ABI746_04075 [Dermatophilaceae bacterium]
MTVAPAGDPASCAAAAADLAALAQRVRGGALTNASADGTAHTLDTLDTLAGDLSAYAAQLSRAQGMFERAEADLRERVTALAAAGRARSRLVRSCEAVVAELTPVDFPPVARTNAAREGGARGGARPRPAVR